MSSRRRMLASLAFTAMIPTAAAAQDYRPDFHPEQLKGPPAGKPNPVRVLGTTHLSGLPNSFDRVLLTPLLDRLEA